MLSKEWTYVRDVATHGIATVFMSPPEPKPNRAQSPFGSSSYSCGEWFDPTSAVWSLAPVTEQYRDIGEEIADAYKRFATSQVSLEADIARVVAKNLWDLYAR